MNRHALEVSCLLAAGVLMLAGCESSSTSDSSTPSQTGEEAPPANVAELPTNVFPRVGLTGDASCEPPIFRGDAPSLEAWAAASTAIVVGTIADVRIIDDPFVVSHDGEGLETSWEFGTREDCHDEHSQLSLRVDIHLEDVESILGESVGDEVIVRITKHQWDLTPESAEDGSVQWRDNVHSMGDIIHGLFERGTRIGGGLVRRSPADVFVFDFRLFEIFDEVVYLQRHSTEYEREIQNGTADHECPQVDWRAMFVPWAYDGKDWKDFRRELESLNRDVDDVAADIESVRRYRTRYHDADIEDTPWAHRSFLPTCRGTIPDGNGAPSGGPDGPEEPL